jgi:hypothetical protein
MAPTEAPPAPAIEWRPLSDTPNAFGAKSDSYKALVYQRPDHQWTCRVYLPRSEMHFDSRVSFGNSDDAKLAAEHIIAQHREETTARA